MFECVINHTISSLTAKLHGCILIVSNIDPPPKRRGSGEYSTSSHYVWLPVADAMGSAKS